MTHTDRTRRAAGAFAAVAAIGAVALSSSVVATADSGEPTRAKAAVVKMKQKGKELKFKGPETVAKGAELEVVNKTNPRKVGPHTLSLVKGKKMPTTREELKRCGELKGVCGRIFKAHEVDPQTFEVGRVLVTAGKPGWDKGFGKRGDSWFTEEEGELFGQKVSAKRGKTLHMLCIVHPEMQAQIEVVGKR